MGVKEGRVKTRYNEGDTAPANAATSDSTFRTGPAVARGRGKDLCPVTGLLFPVGQQPMMGIIWPHQALARLPSAPLAVCANREQNVNTPSAAAKEEVIACGGACRH
ncbi:hypothetical protein MRX96_009879 [Rhipicephalus microplus]